MFCRKCGSETFERSHCPECGCEVSIVWRECSAAEDAIQDQDKYDELTEADADEMEVAPAATGSLPVERIGVKMRLAALAAAAFMLCVLAACVASVACRIGESNSYRGVRPVPVDSAEGYFEQI